jgi:Fe-S cluster assembly protein SufB
MSSREIELIANREYKYGFVTEIEADTVPPGLNEDIIRLISAKKNEPEWLLEWRLKAYRHWTTMQEPRWANVHYPPIDYQSIVYYAAPKGLEKRPKSLEEVDPQILRTYEKLGIPLREQEVLAGVAVDAVFDSVSVATTFKEKLAELGIIFCSFSEAVREHPELVRKYLGSVVPYTDNFFAALNSAVFSDGSFVYVPKGVRCPMELSTYFRINARSTGQFERTLIIADEGAYVSYLEGCLPPWEEVSYGDCLKTIREVAMHDQVLNGRGLPAQVAKLMRRGYRGQLIEITPLSEGNRFHLTPEHPVLAISKERGRGDRWLNAEPEFIPAGQLKPGDLLVFPVSQIQQDDPSLSDEFLRLLGYYAATGRAASSDGHQLVEFSFEAHQAEVSSLIERFTGERPLRARDHVIACDGALARALVEHGGETAQERRFSKSVMDLPPDRQRLILDSYYSVGGSVGRDHIYRTRVTSRALAFQLQELLARQGIYARIKRQRNSVYIVSYALDGRDQRVKRRDGYFLVPISSIRSEPYEGFVYNFETAEEPHTYLVKGFTVHNCTAPMRDENQLHAAVVELIAHDYATIKYSTVQNWYPGDQEGRGGIYNFVTKRGKCLGRGSKISWTQVETGSAITWKYPSCILIGDDSVGEFYSVALTNNRQQADTGTKMIHIGKNTRSTIISKGISAGHGQNTYRGMVKIMKSAAGARNYSQCDSLLLGDKCGAHTFPYLEVKNSSAQVEHEASTSRIGENQIFYCRQRGLSSEEAVSMIVSGFCREVFRELPMEFAVEAQKLLGISLEGSVG